MERNGRIFKSLDKEFEDEDMSGGGLCCELSWETIKPHLEQACALKGNERLIGIVIDDSGIRFKLEYTPEVRKPVKKKK